MTQIQLDDETVAKIRSTMGPILVCDRAGQPVRIMYIDPYPDHEPILSPEERKRRKEQPGGLSTAEFVAYLQKQDRT